MRQNMALKRQEGLLVISDLQAPVIQNPDTLCQAVAREWGRQTYQGVVLDFEQAPTPDRQAFVSALDGLTQRHQKALYVPPAYASATKEAIVLVDTAISGGNFKQYLEESKERYGTIALDLQRLSMDFSLPATQGMGTPITLQQLQELRQRHSPTVYFSQELCSRYFTYQLQGQTHFVLFDDAHTLEQKIRIGQGLHATAGFCIYHEVEDLLPTLFAKKR